MSNITSITANEITSQTKSLTGVTSQTNLDVQSKTELNVQSGIDYLEKEAFLYTARVNAAKMFSKYL